PAVRATVRIRPTPPAVAGGDRHAHGRDAIVQNEDERTATRVEPVVGNARVVQRGAERGRTGRPPPRGGQVAGVAPGHAGTRRAAEPWAREVVGAVTLLTDLARTVSADPGRTAERGGRQLIGALPRVAHDHRIPRAHRRRDEPAEAELVRTG